MIFSKGANLVCGVRFEGVTPGASVGQPMQGIRAAIGLDPGAGGIVVSFQAFEYAVSGNLDTKESLDAYAKSLRAHTVESGWLRAEGLPETRPRQGRVERIREVGAISYVTSEKNDLSILTALLAGKRISVGLRVTGHKEESLRSGPVMMSDTERLTVQSCLDVLAGSSNK